MAMAAAVGDRVHRHKSDNYWHRGLRSRVRGKFVGRTVHSQSVAVTVAVRVKSLDCLVPTKPKKTAGDLNLLKFQIKII